MPELRYFVVVHTALRDEAPTVQGYDDSDEALDAFESAEATVTEGYKVTLLGAASLDDLKVTHTNLFGLEAMRQASA